uniref:Uncharacterized protein n=1 Tax=Aegilops tauschii subsp. strangulata TaxID=200361 RepID=A0A453JTD3_AEGTS
QEGSEMKLLCAGSSSWPPRASRTSSSSTARGRSTFLSPPRSSAPPPSPASTPASGSCQARLPCVAPPFPTSVSSASVLSKWSMASSTPSLRGAPSWRS